MKSLQIKRIAFSTIAALSMLAAIPAAQAATAPSGNFNLTINLTSVCTVTTPGDITLNYSSFDTVPATGSSNFNVTCTDTLPYSLATDVAGGTVLGLNYTLATSAAGGLSGNGAAQPYTVDAAIAAGQAGTCAGATCQDISVHTVTVTY